MPFQRNGSSKSSVLLATTLFVVVILALGALATNVISTMRSTADAHDDVRATRAAEAAVRSLKDRLSATIRNAAEADVAFNASNTADFAGWARDNWGSTSADNPLYDNAALTVGGSTFSVTVNSTIDPIALFWSALQGQADEALVSRRHPVINFVGNANGVWVVASEAVQPHVLVTKAQPHAVLSLFRKIHDADLGLLSQQYQLDGMRLFRTRPDHMLSVALRNVDGQVVGFIGWKSLAVGTQVYNEVRMKVFAAAAILIVFIVTVVLAGGAEIRRMARAARHANHEATHDTLSGLFNRAGLMVALQRHLEKGEAIRLYMLDLDGFKLVNDAWGHQVGDRLIERVSSALSGAHPEIVHAARLGGDEFALVQVGPTPAADFAEGVLKAFGGVFDIGGRTVEVGLSIGSASGEGLSDRFELLRRADMALYKAKADGKGRAVAYHSDLDRQRERLLHLEDQLRQTLADGGVAVVYQPLVCAASGTLNGVEALARWATENGPVSPEVFIPLAERSGLIDTLGAQILRHSIRNAKTWPALDLSVNVSPIQLCNPTFAGSVLQLLDEEGFDPKRLTLEVTEGVLMSNPDQAQRAIDELRAVGIRFALDDFGCGYASIGALRKFGFDSMKIDRSLVSAAHEGKGQEVLKATIALASALNIPVTAEGIETGAQANLLRDAGCATLQGYLIGRPMSASDIASLADKGRPLAPAA